jgi:hypothetical protein
VRLATIAAALLLAGCGGTFVMHKNLDELRQAVLAEMNMVIPHIKSEHLKECQKLLEQTSILGAKYVIPVNGKLVPSIQHSCFHQGRGATTLTSVESDRKTVVLAVQMMKVAGMYGTGSPSEVRACRFRITKADTAVSVWHADTKAPMNSTCHQL